MIVKRTIRNTVQEYEYKGKEKKYNSYIQVKIEKEKKEKLEQKALEKGYKGYSELLRVLIEKEIENYKK